MSLARSLLLPLVAFGCHLLFPSPGLAGSDPAQTNEPPPLSEPELRNELGVHYGSPLKLSAHAAHVFPLRKDTIERIEGLEILGEIGLAGARVGAGWATRGATYYNGSSLTLDLVRTWESVVDPLAFPPDQTLIGVGYRIIALGLTLRIEALYNLGQERDRYALGWSIGISE